MREADQRGEKLGLSQDELAFYDALAENQSAVDVLGDAQLRVIATELVGTVRRNTSIDWTVKESVKARLRVLVRRALRKYGYPPDLQETGLQTPNKACLTATPPSSLHPFDRYRHPIYSNR